MRLTTSKPISNVSISSSGSTASEVIKQIAATEKQYQEELNRGFTALSEGSFKSLRRQLPVTRQKVEWEKVGGYRVGLTAISLCAPFCDSRLMDCSWGKTLEADDKGERA